MLYNLYTKSETFQKFINMNIDYALNEQNAISNPVAIFPRYVY